jgi:hypothetical protein
MSDRVAFAAAACHLESPQARNSRHLEDTRMAQASARSIRTVSLAALLLAVALPAAAQWAWKDQNGRLVYSDQAPPPSVKAAQIVRQPGASPAQPGASQPSSPVPASADAKVDGPRTGGPKTLAEQDAEFRKRQKERADAEAKAQRDEQLLALKAADCERQRGYLRTLEDGNRIFQTNPQGEREAMDDARRDSEIRRVRESLIKNCA